MAALDKDPAILSLLTRLRERLGDEAFVLADHWETELCAVGIASPRNIGVLAYLSCDCETPDRFDYELELPPLPGDEFPYRVAGRGSEVTFDDLSDVLKEHFNRGEADI